MDAIKKALNLAYERLDDTDPFYERVFNALLDGMAELESVQAVPYAWHVPPMARMYFGEYAQIDAEAEARRVGGTAKAVALYTAPPAIGKMRQPLTDEQIKKGMLEADPAGEDLCRWSFAAGIAFAEKAHGIGGE